ncbi:MAG: PDZ domain-containing protein, partial [Planctomycetota bacterium]
LTVNVDFDVQREAAPEVSLPAEDYPSVENVTAYDELSSLGKHLAELESRLDDACVEIESGFGEDEDRSITGTRILGTPWVVSKSTVIGDNAVATTGDETITLEVVERDAENDLVLLKAPEINQVGVDLALATSEIPVGAFLLSPAADDLGAFSVVGTPAFRSNKQSSRGFLGVVPETYQENKGAVLNQVTDDGAAKRAGLLAGDVITKLNDTIIRTQLDMREFLSKADPNEVITATLRRNEDELTKSITLGAVPTSSRHAADQMAKSSRRDGFSEVFSHDADLDPEDCGGPLYDLDGNFVGLNIARNSRVRSFALPAAELQSFITQATSDK